VPVFKVEYDLLEVRHRHSEGHYSGADVEGDASEYEPSSSTRSEVDDDSIDDVLLKEEDDENDYSENSFFVSRFDDDDSQVSENYSHSDEEVDEAFDTKAKDDEDDVEEGEGEGEEEQEGEVYILLLGMVYSQKCKTHTLGQCPRDRLRCKAIEDLGYSVVTLDHQHEAKVAEPKKHIKSNISGYCNSFLF